ncbi:hypothetical protein Tco_0526265 [Tanacetum coccineum]
MSDSDESRVTYMEVSSPFEGLSDIGSPRADDHEYLELPGMLEDPYVEAPLQAPPSPDYVPALRSQSRHHLRDKRKALLTSNWKTMKFMYIAKARKILMASILATGAKVSS